MPSTRLVAAALPILPQVKHPLYRGNPRLDLQFHTFVAGIGLLAVTAAGVSLATPDHAGTAILCMYAGAFVTLGRCIGRATQRVWARTPTNHQPGFGKMLLSLLTSIPALWSVYAGVAYAVARALHNGDWIGVVLAVAFAWVYYALQIAVEAWAWHRTPRHPRSRAHRRR